MGSKSYSTIEVCGKTHVLTINEDRRTKLYKGQLMENANYRGTGLALCGVLKTGKNLEQWKKRKQK